MTTLLSATPAEIKRFMSYVEILPNGCWFWNGARSRGKGNKKWYASFHWQGKTIRGHRFSCEQIKGVELPSNHHRDHLCRFSLCVNPDHVDVVHKDVNQARRHSPAPPMSLQYWYEDGQLMMGIVANVQMETSSLTGITE